VAPGAVRRLHHQGMDQALAADGVGQALEAGLVEVLAHVVRAGLDQGDVDDAEFRGIVFEGHGPSAVGW